MRWSMWMDTWSKNGMHKKTPGPTTLWKRPSLRTTARSHCVVMRTVLPKTSPMAAATGSDR